MDSLLRQIFLQTLNQDLYFADYINVRIPGDGMWGPKWWYKEREWFYETSSHN